MECFINPGIMRITVIEVPIIEDSLYTSLNDNTLMPSILGLTKQNHQTCLFHYLSQNEPSNVDISIVSNHFTILSIFSVPDDYNIIEEVTIWLSP